MYYIRLCIENHIPEPEIDEELDLGMIEGNNPVFQNVVRNLDLVAGRQLRLLKINSTKTYYYLYTTCPNPRKFYTTGKTFLLNIL